MCPHACGVRSAHVPSSCACGASGEASILKPPCLTNTYSLSRGGRGRLLPPAPSATAPSLKLMLSPKQSGCGKSDGSSKYPSGAYTAPGYRVTNSPGRRAAFAKHPAPAPVMPLAAIAVFGAVCCPPQTTDANCSCHTRPAKAVMSRALPGCGSAPELLVGWSAAHCTANANDIRCGAGRDKTLRSRFASLRKALSISVSSRQETLEK